MVILIYFSITSQFSQIDIDGARRRKELSAAFAPERTEVILKE
jgi:hypothetical protein